MFRRKAACCTTLAEVLKGAGGAADPTVFHDDDGMLVMVIGMVDTPGGLGLYEHPVRYCPFCGSPVHSADEIQAKAMN